jgi:hypothetical protein
MLHTKNNKKGNLVKKGKKPKEAIIYKGNSREGLSGIDGYRHREQVLKPLLIPFANKLKKTGRNISVLEDHAPAYQSNKCNHYFMISDGAKLL